MQIIILQFEMICLIRTIYLQTENRKDKRKHFKTIFIIVKEYGYSISISNDFRVTFL